MRVWRVGVALFLGQVAGLLAWTVWQLAQLARGRLGPSFTNSVFPFAGAPVTMIPVLEEIYAHCNGDVCTTQNKLVWFVAPLISAPLYFIYCAAQIIAPPDRLSVVVASWNATGLALTALWSAWAFLYVRRRGGGGRSPTAASVAPLSQDWFGGRGVHL